MKAHSQNFKIRLGLFVIVGLALFVAAIFIIGRQKNLFNPVFKLTTTFYNVSGLQVGNNVRFAGINVGTVDNISIITDSTVRVDMLIRKEVQKFIKSDSEVGIGSEGLIGDRLMIISQGSSDTTVAKNGQELISNEPVETDEIIASLEVTAGFAQIIASEIADMMVKINSGQGTLGQLIHDENFAKNLDQTMTNLKQSSQGLEENMEAVKHNFLLKGFFKKKDREAKKREAAAKAAAEQKAEEKK